MITCSRGGNKVSLGRVGEILRCGFGGGIGCPFLPFFDRQMEFLSTLDISPFSLCHTCAAIALFK